MPKFLLKFFENKSLEFHLLIAILLGFALRLICSYFIYTPMALDDLNHAWGPAINLFNNDPLGLPAYRSQILPYLLFIFIKLASLLGFSNDPLIIIQTMNVGLSVISLLSILGGYYYFKNESNKLYGITLMYLLAVYAILPYASTRAFGEAVAIPFLMLGFGLARYAKEKEKYTLFALAFLSLGLATLFRYQVGLIFVSYSVILLFNKNKKYFYTSILIGVVTLFFEVLKDLIFDGYPLKTLYEYFKINFTEDFGASKWYNLILLVFALSFPPFCFVLLKNIKKAVLDNLEAFICLIVFITAHSITSHKEERFMLPIIPLLLILLSTLWIEAKDSKIVKYVFAYPFIVVNTFFLLIAISIPSQTGLIEPLVKANRILKENGILLNMNADNKWAHHSYLRKDIIIVNYASPLAEPEYLENLFLKDKSLKNIYIISEDSAKILNLNMYNSELYNCNKVSLHASVIDKLLYRLNPKYNNRKKTTGSILCQTNH